MARRILSELEHAGLGPPKNLPDEQWKELPEDVTRLNSRQLGKHYQGYVAFAEYAEHELALADCRKREISEVLQHRAAYLTARYPDVPKWRLESLQHKDRKYAKLLRILTKATTRVILLESVVERYNRRVNLMSREITRRQEENNPHRRRNL